MKSKILFGIFCGIALGHCQNVPAAIVVRQEAGTGAEGAFIGFCCLIMRKLREFIWH